MLDKKCPAIIVEGLGVGRFIIKSEDGKDKLRFSNYSRREAIRIYRRRYDLSGRKVLVINI